MNIIEKLELEHSLKKEELVEILKIMSTMMN